MTDGADVGDDLIAAKEREAALQKILEVISRSRDDEQPVFNAVLKSALTLCDADMCVLMIARPETDDVVLAAGQGQATNAFVPGISTWPMDAVQEPIQAIRENRMIHTEDMRDTDLYREGDPSRRGIVDQDGMRTRLILPLVGDSGAIGSFVLFRKAVKRFSDAEIALLTSFAAQAVIAIEKVQQFRELHERLEREEATRQILGVINQSRDDETNVFQAILERAAKLCEAPIARLELANDDRTAFRLVAAWGEELRSFKLGEEWSLDLPYFVPTTIREARAFRIHDLADRDLYRSGDPTATRIVDEEGIRSYMTVPLIKAGIGIGCIVLSRREVKPFDERDTALVETFAAQAVIAIENVRQFREVQERLERESASRRILDVISRSRDDDQPVFETILENAARLCQAPMAHLQLVDDTRSKLIIAAHWGDPLTAYEPGVSTLPLDGDHISARVIREKQAIHIADLADDDLYRTGNPVRVKIVDEEGMRTFLAVPLISADQAIGVLILPRREVRPFTPDQIALVETFAAQAVIAIENARQFRELQTRLEREKATREILDVVSRSRDDENPVFNIILESACRLCEAQSAFVIVRDESGEFVYSPAQVGATEEFASVFKDWRAPYATSPLGAVVSMRERRVVAFEDLADTDLYRSGNPDRVRQVDLEGVRSLVNVPLLSGDEAVGVMILYRREVRPFSDDNIALVEAFAAQAVIAIENVRQLKALEDRTEEVQALNSSLEQRVAEQVGEIERMGKLKSFLPSAVADAVVSSGSEDMLKSHRALLGILFCDIRGFTAFCETAEPEETMAVLQAYHHQMGELIAAHGAGVDHRMGDGIMVLFNDPLPCDDPAGDAVRLAMAMREKMAELCKSWKKLGYRLGFGVGVSLGYATVGMVGYEGRADYTASGTAVNLAARLCDKAEDGEILLSPRAAIAVEDDMVCEPGGELELKGLTAPVKVTRVVAAK